MKKIIKLLIATFGTCLSAGFIVSIIEKKKGKVGWVEGHKPYGIYEKHIKRPLDFALALFSLIFLWPVLLIIAVAVRINMGSPVVFTQERPGLGGKIFKIYKFRTMTDDRDEDGDLLPDEKRLTGFGKWLRATSGDARVIIGQTTESLVNKGFREVSPIHFHRGHDLLFYNARYANFEGILCQSA